MSRVEGGVEWLLGHRSCHQQQATLEKLMVGMLNTACTHCWTHYLLATPCVTCVDRRCSTRRQAAC